MNGVSSIVRIDLLVYSVILNLIMYCYLSQNKKGESRSSVLFKRILASTVFVSVIEIISWSVSQVGKASLIPIRYWSNAVFLSSIGLTAAFGLCYLDYKIFGNRVKCKRRLLVYLIPTYINIGFAVYNHFSRGFLFSVDSMNVYHRGIAVNISNGILYFFAIGVTAYFYRHKSLISGRVAQAISVFVFVPVLGSILQMLAYGTTFGMPAYTMASFMTLLLVEKDEMARDPLTSLYTRANLENRLRFKLKSREAFTAMIIDLNDFKHINDTYGHLEGDKVLQKVSEILTRSVQVEDMVCRYGGDEFFVLIENGEDVGESFIEGLDGVFEAYNRTNPHSYQIKLSYGYEFVKKPGDVKLQELIFRIDQMMYEDKARRKSQERKECLI